jgi:D-glycero-beta-D-manno-heptose 1-phosphate adenylyltransferase
MSVSVSSAQASAAAANDDMAASGGLELVWHTRPATTGAGTVVATGVFDLLHVGHLRFLRAARAAGERLLVGVEDDVRTRARKGAGRPIVAAEERCEMLAALEPVEGVFMICGPPELEPLSAYSSLLAVLTPAMLAFTEGDPAAPGKQRVAERLGAEVCAVPLVAGHSSTLMVERLVAGL